MNADIAKKERIREIDILKGLGIFLMVFDHVGWGSMVHTYIQSFHMPLFFIVSGYLWKSRPFKVEILKKIKTLGIPYLFFSLLHTAINYYLTSGQMLNSNIKAILIFPTDMLNMPLTPALWFLPCMFFTCLFYNLINKWFKENKLLVLLMCLAIFVSGLIIDRFYSGFLPFSIDPALTALLFFCFGDLLKTETIKKYLLNIKPFFIVLFLFAVQLALTLKNGSVDMRSCRYHNAFLFLFDAVLGTVVYWNICRKVQYVRALKYVNEFFITLSKESVVFMCTNQLMIMVFSIIMSKLFAEQFSTVQSILIFILSVIGCLLLSKIYNTKYLKCFIGKY